MVCARVVHGRTPPAKNSPADRPGRITDAWFVATFEIKLWEVSDFKPDSKNARRTCEWSGTENCSSKAEFTVVDRLGRHWGACEVQVLGFTGTAQGGLNRIRCRPRRGAARRACCTIRSSCHLSVVDTYPYSRPRCRVEGPMPDVG